uniref:UBA domain-containing protein n=1 Tax=Chromera velia CCMP2878 TaxID=1169474 RepID=A0A0G4FTD8_9ALVE|eukprot:Cvel_18670.t1-p1 / transcript=Cvel_18670.t1 / gene=Cvel_18670 / organism=Chromera_velia_CCMP2878 / gene_product=hypothetical protein / transcript_product=hypothetical protein / location=Cvel_scaffold1561:24010-29234(+) / protein_length=577 / sequence_SO=supercontig / SO=protein_coding / is_pseudo=false
MKVKCNYNSQHEEFDFDEKLPLADLRLKIRETYQAKPGHGFKLFYKDPEGDMCTLTEGTYQDAKALAIARKEDPSLQLVLKLDKDASLRIAKETLSRTLKTLEGEGLRGLLNNFVKKGWPAMVEQLERLLGMMGEMKDGEDFEEMSHKMERKFIFAVVIQTEAHEDMVEDLPGAEFFKMLNMRKLPIAALINAIMSPLLKFFESFSGGDGKFKSILPLLRALVKITDPDTVSTLNNAFQVADKLKDVSEDERLKAMEAKLKDEKLIKIMRNVVNSEGGVFCVLEPEYKDHVKAIEPALQDLVKLSESEVAPLGDAVAEVIQKVIKIAVDKLMGQMAWKVLIRMVAFGLMMAAEAIKSNSWLSPMVCEYLKLDCDPEKPADPNWKPGAFTPLAQSMFQGMKECLQQAPKTDGEEGFFDDQITGLELFYQACNTGDLPVDEPSQDLLGELIADTFTKIAEPLTEWAVQEDIDRSEAVVRTMLERGLAFFMELSPVVVPAAAKATAHDSTKADKTTEASSAEKVQLLMSLGFDDRKKVEEALEARHGHVRSAATTLASMHMADAAASKGKVIRMRSAVKE